MMSDWVSIEMDRIEASPPAKQVYVGEKLRGRCEHGFVPGLCEDDDCSHARRGSRNRYVWAEAAG